MMRSIVIATLALSMLFLSNPSVAQVYGKVGDQRIDSDFIRAVQIINPDFTFNSSSAIFTGGLEKYYVMARIKADVVRKSGTDKNPDLKKQIELVRQLAEDRLLSEYYEQHKSDSVMVLESEIKNYYNQHTPEFIVPGQYSYLEAMVFDGSDSTVDLVVQKMKTYGKDEAMLDEFKMGNKDSYIIGYERDRTIYPFNAEHPLLKDLPLKKVSEPFKHPDGTIFVYYLISKTPEKPMPYLEVKELCRGRVLADKLGKINDAIEKTGVEQYPIQLDYQFFQQ